MRQPSVVSIAIVSIATRTPLLTPRPLAAQAPRTKHLSGPFFTEGTFTQNSPEEVSELMQAMRDATRMPG